ncbi:MAG: transporter substrate-binding domain-containing protein [Oscillospiraceae bacterium]|nr:transporter substrate-binding domain-containing protein [Oscillospiraceae bacterium]
MKKIIIAAIAAVFAMFAPLAAGSCTNDGGREKTYEKNPDIKDPLRVGVNSADLPPMIIWDRDNKLTGFEADVIEQAAKRLGVACEIVPIDPGTEREKFESGSIDCVFGIMDAEKQRQNYAMTEPYVTIPQVIMVYEGSKIKSKSDIANVSVIMSTPAESLADEDKLGIHFKRVSSSRDYAKTFEQLAGGYSDAAVCDKTTAIYMQDLDRNFKILDENAAEVQYSAAFASGEDKKSAAMDAALKDIINEGILSELAKKWFGQEY